MSQKDKTMNEEQSPHNEWAAALEAALQQSPYWNALPMKGELVDLCKASLGGTDFAFKWLHQLLENTTASIELEASHAQSSKLERLYFESVANARRGSRSSLSFAYPLFIAPKEDAPFEYVAAPVFIWEVSLEPSPHRAHTWVLERKTQHTVSYNKLLSRFLKDKHGIQPSHYFKSIIGKHQVNRDSVSQICNTIAVQLGFSGNLSSLAVQPCPDNAEIATFDELPTIHWSGVFGTFPEQEVGKLEKLLALPSVQAALPASFQRHPFGVFLSNPYQQAVLRNADRRVQVVMGTGGTGKTYTVSNLISNALSNGARCLVLGSDVSNLQHIQRNLMAMGVQRLSFVVKNPYIDKSVLLETLKGAKEYAGKTPAFDKPAFEAQLEKNLFEYQKLDKNRAELNATVFGTENWTETVGLFLACHGQEPRELLNSQLNPRDFQFTFREHDRINEELQRTEALFEHIGTLKHPLNNLHAEVFTLKPLAEAREWVGERLKYFRGKAERLLHRYITQKASYSEALKDSYVKHYEALKQQIAHIRQLRSLHNLSYGAEFLEESNALLSLVGRFSKKHQKAKMAKAEVVDAYQKLVSQYNAQPFFEYKFSTINLGNAHLLEKNLLDFDKSLEEWRERIPSIVEVETTRLNLHTLQPHLPFKDVVEDLETGHEQLIDEINDAKLYHENMVHNNNTIAKRQKNIEDIIDQLETSDLNLRDFGQFYRWQSQWLQLPEQSKKIVRAIVKVKPQNWSAAFGSWYLHHVLDANYSESILRTDNQLDSFNLMFERLKQLLPVQIQALWSERQHNALKSVKKEDKGAVEALFAKQHADLNNEQDLSDLFARHHELISEFLPALLMPAALANELLPNQQGLFDLLIIDNAHRELATDYVGLLPLAHRAVIFGDPDADLLEGDSLLSYAQQLADASTSLPIRQRDDIRGIGDFKNTFTTSCPTVAALDALPISNVFVEYVEGRYDDGSATNPFEAERCLALLDLARKKGNGEFPAIGIVCYTMQQKYFIMRKILETKQQREVQSQRLADLEKSGLKVLHVSEVAAGQFEQLIVSLVYGPNDLKGKLTLDLGTIRDEYGRVALNAVLDANIGDMYFCHSLPQSFFQESFVGRYVGWKALANFLHFQMLNSWEQQRFLEAARTQRPTPSAGLPSDFAQEVFAYLQPYFEKDRLKTRSVASAFTRCSLTVQPLSNYQRPVIILCDGICIGTPASAPIWERDTVRSLLAQGNDVVKTSSFHWWKDPKAEARRLAGQIIKLEKAREEKQEGVHSRAFS